MQNKFLKTLCFMFYTWCIYQSYIFVVVTMMLSTGCVEVNLTNICKFLKWFFLMPFDIALSCFLEIPKHIDFLFVDISLLCLYGVIVIPWWIRQTVGRAWYLALLGLIVGPGIVLLQHPLCPGIYVEWPTFYTVNIFYAILFLGGYWQKQSYPNNKFANKIRAILKWPCLRT